MLLEKNTNNMRSPFTVLAVLTLAITVLWTGASVSNAQTTPKRWDDFVGDQRTDYTTLQFTTGGPITWRVTGNPAAPGPNQAFQRQFNYGLTDSDSVVTGDYVGDTKWEPTVYRDSTSTFYVGNFPSGTGGITLNRAVPFGNGATDNLGVQGDYDGDGKTDYALVRVGANNALIWYWMSSSTNTVRGVTHGSLTGVTGPAIFPGADFNGDGRDDLVYLFRNASGSQVTYQIGDANTGAGIRQQTFGNYNTDFSMAPADYTGDGRADFVAVRQTQGVQSVWYIMNSVTNAVTATSFGIADPNFTDLDLPVRGDFDGDGRFDICVWRDSNQTFYYVSSQFNNVGGQKSGNTGDFPLGSLYAY